MMSIIEQIADTIQRFKMIALKERVLVAVSGGPDSMALFFILQHLAPRLEINLAIAHLNHGIRPDDADREAAFVHKLAQDQATPYHHKNIQLDNRKGSLEERARRERYAFLTHTARRHGYTKIALGHQADDNAEALLINLLRGSGIRGLGGIPPVRDQWIVRPMIEVRRHQILAFLKNRQIDYMHDTSNDDTRFVRNRIRHKLLPFLEQAFNPDIVGTLNRTASLCRDEEAWFRSYLRPLLESIQEPASDGSLLMELTPLTKTHPAIQRRLIREALKQWQGHLQRMAAVHIEAVINLVSKGHCGGRLNLPHGLVAQRTENHLRLYFQDNLNLTQNFGSTPYSHMLESKDDLPAEIPIHACNGVLRFTLVRPPTTKELAQCPPNCAWLDADTLQFPLIIRNARPGDRLAPLGLRGTQKIKDVFINAKVSRQSRWNRPLVISKNEVLWVAGLRRSNLHLVVDNTREVLAVEWDTWSPTYNGAQ